MSAVIEPTSVIGHDCLTVHWDDGHGPIAKHVVLDKAKREAAEQRVNLLKSVCPPETHEEVDAAMRAWFDD